MAQKAKENAQAAQARRHSEERFQFFKLYIYNNYYYYYYYLLLIIIITIIIYR